ncbi:CBS domain-containing protein [Mesorhizobium muleiense]|uniref:CBS domain-containing protein n=1 Tax=Mesorhizobium muleiense TaxID=1004279 RepID=UPI001F46C01F|nr:CBS domain-containing protein [Mesorhizobium muleiense]MCF6112985.1 CBS domain-containing protein [Mesorhizobium muleiense]
MRISECMTRKVQVASPDQSLRDAARVMADLDAGVLPVGENERLVGMITDRDIAVRGIAEGRGPDTKIRDVMSAEVQCCFDDQDVGDALQNMRELKVRRMPVISRDRRLVGIVSLGDLATNGEPAWAGEALGGISQPGGDHSQTAH